MPTRTRYWPWPLLILIPIIAFAVTNHQRNRNVSIIDTIYGSYTIEDPCTLELLHSRAMQRLKGVHQYGVLRYATPMEEYSRYDHSIGVYALLRRYKRPLKEQITGLLEDSSHTVFSHVADFVFDHHSADSSYQDDIHSWYLRRSGLSDILEKYGYNVDGVHPQNSNLPVLEQPLPGLCADRIEYNLQGGLRRGLLTLDDVNGILDDLRFEHPHWYLTSVENARKLGRISLNMSENVWGTAWGLLIYSWTSDALKHSLKTGLISYDDFHFSTDDDIWHRLIASKDPLIKERIHRVLHFEKLFRHCEPEEQDLHLRGKFRGVDPLVLTDFGLRRLTEVDPEYKVEYEAVRAVMKRGWPLKLIDSAKEDLPGNEPLFSIAY